MHTFIGDAIAPRYLVCASAAASGSTGGAPTTAATPRRTTTPRASEAAAPVVVHVGEDAADLKQLDYLPIGGGADEIMLSIICKYEGTLPSPKKD